MNTYQIDCKATYLDTLKSALLDEQISRDIKANTEEDARELFVALVMKQYRATDRIIRRLDYQNIKII